MGIDDESSHPELCSEVAGGVTHNIVSLFREPDAGNLPVRFDEREQETELRQTGLRRVMRKHPNSHREAKATAPVLDSTRHSKSLRFPFAYLANKRRKVAITRLHQLSSGRSI
jgi:hypothetical protein